MGVCTADVDGDGWEDLYVTALGGNHLYRNNHDGTFTDITEQAGVARRRLVGRLRLRRLRSRRPARSVRQPLREDRPRAPARVRQGQDLRVPRHRGAVRPARTAGRGRLSLPQRRQRALHRRVGEGRRLGPARLLRPRRRLVRLQRRRLAGSLRGERLDAELPVRQPEGRHVQGAGVSARRRRQRRRRGAGQHGRRARRLRSQRPVQPLRDQLLRGIQRPLSQRRRSLQRRLVPIADRAGEPALRRLGRRVPRLRQRRVARPHRRQRARLPAARSAASSGRQPAIASASCCTTTAATARSTRWRRATARR